MAAADIVGAWYRFHRARIARDDKDEDQDPRSKLEALLKERPSVVHARFASPPFGLVLEAGYVRTAVWVYAGIAIRDGKTKEWVKIECMINRFECVYPYCVQLPYVRPHSY